MTHARSPTLKLHKEVCQMANVLKDMGVKKGDRIGLYHAHGSGGRSCDASLCANWRGAYGCVWRI